MCIRDRAVRFNCPIYTYEFILDAAGVILEEGDEEPEEGAAPAATTKKKKKKATSGNALSQYSDEDLATMLNEVLEEEDYERAAEIRDEIKRRESEGSK